MRHDKAAVVLDLARHMAASAEGLTLDEMARAVGVGRRTAERLRDAVGLLFPQMEAVEDPPTKRFRIPGGLDGFAQQPTAEELAALRQATAQARAEGVGARAQSLAALERKVLSAVKAPARRRLEPDVEALLEAEQIAVQAGPRPTEDASVLDVIRQAVKAMKAVGFTYHGGSRSGAHRSVAPFGVLLGRTNYLVGAELGSSQAKNWRLDRIEAIEVLDQTASAPRSFSLADYAAESFGIYHDEMQDIVLRALPAGVEDARRWRFHPRQTVEAQEDGTLLIRFRAGGLRELAWHLFSWGDRLEIVGPRALKEEMARQLETAARAHGLAMA